MKVVVALRRDAREAHEDTWADRVFELIGDPDREKPPFARMVLDLLPEQVEKLRAEMHEILIIEEEIRHQTQAPHDLDGIGP